jgi:hypothetical protein
MAAGNKYIHSFIHSFNYSGEGGPEGEDTMKNLRKTFAGIFGDIK